MNEKKKQVRVRQLLDRLQNGQEISLRDFKSVLGKDEHEEYEAMWVNEKDKRSIVKPKEILLYENKLREVKLSHARHEKHRQNYGSSQRSVALENQTENLMEQLVEFWIDITSTNSSLLIWFDRSEIKTLSIEELPHVIYSKSYYKRSDGFFTKRTKREIKIEILENLLNPIQESIMEDNKLKTRKKRLTKSDFKDFKV
jgi:hypothetical protein